ncbi:MAG: alpha/beta hydrolase [Gammaproteobacteria bacterium]|nr:alpha/beta hydrolase [Gammaproteobacteria bacterium]
MKNFVTLDIRFKNSRNITLAGKLELPASPQYFAIFSPCFTCTKETLATYRISQQLAKKHAAVLRLDFTGLGESEGDFADSNFSTMIDDIICANNYLTEHYQQASVLLGHSMGGTASYAAAAVLNEIKAIVSIASPSTPSHVLHHFGDALDKLKAGITSEFFVAGKAYGIKPQFLHDLEKHRLDTDIATLKKAILIFHAEGDKLVGIEHAEHLFLNARHPKSFISLDSADHVLTERSDALYVAGLIDSWCRRYLP